MYSKTRNLRVFAHEETRKERVHTENPERKGVYSGNPERMGTCRYKKTRKERVHTGNPERDGVNTGKPGKKGYMCRKPEERKDISCTRNTCLVGRVFDNGA